MTGPAESLATTTTRKRRRVAIGVLLLLMLLPSLTTGCPAWYDARRFHAHTRLALNEFCSVETKTCQSVFENAADLFRELGVRAFVRHTKTKGEGTWWRSASGPPESWHEFVRETQRDLPKEFADKAHKNDQRVIFYHYPRVSDYFGKIDNGSWLNRNPEGHPVEGPRGYGLCVNSPWRQVYKQQLLELVDFGADGLFFDEIPQPVEGCWCRWCREKFKNRTGSDRYPEKKNLDDPLYVKLLEFNTQSILEHYDEINEAISSRSKNVISLVSLYQVPCPNDGGHIYETTRLMNATAQTAAKTEFTMSDRGSCVAEFRSKDAKLYGHGFEDGPMIAWGWALSRDAAGGRSPHIWAPSLPKEPIGSATAAPFAMAAYGAVANPDHAEAEIPNFKLFNATYRMATKLDPYLNASRPLRWAGIFFSEAARNRYQPTHNVDAWTHVLFATVSAWETMVRYRVPVGIITDWQLDGNLTATPDDVAAYLREEGYKAIICAPDSVSDVQRQTLAAFESKGGAILQLGASLDWSSKKKRFLLERELYANVTKAVGLPPIRVKVDGDALAKSTQEKTDDGYADIFPELDGEEGRLRRQEDKRQERLFRHVEGNAISAEMAGNYAHPQAVPLRQNSTDLTLMVTNDFTWIYGVPSHERPLPVSGMTVQIRDANVTSLDATDILNGQRLPVKRNETAWTIELPTLHQEMAVHLRCSEPCWQGLG